MKPSTLRNADGGLRIEKGIADVDQATIRGNRIRNSENNPQSAVRNPKFAMERPAGEG
jgi:hypothetical protein